MSTFKSCTPPVLRCFLYVVVLVWRCFRFGCEAQKHGEHLDFLCSQRLDDGRLAFVLRPSGGDTSCLSEITQETRPSLPDLNSRCHGYSHPHQNRSDISPRWPTPVCFPSVRSHRASVLQHEPASASTADSTGGGVASVPPAPLCDWSANHSAEPSQRGSLLQPKSR